MMSLIFGIITVIKQNKLDFTKTMWLEKILPSYSKK